MPTISLVDDLRERLRAGRVVAVAGSGVTAAATRGHKLASWSGLVASGLDHASGLPGVPPARIDAGRRLLEAGDSSSLIAAAELVTESLGGRGGGEYAGWLTATLGSLELEDAAVPAALAALGVPLATTNYDDLIERASGWDRVTWLEGGMMQRALQGEERAVAHLHGHCRVAPSVVLGIRSYEEQLRSDTAQGLQHGIASMSSLLFVGVGDGLSDPNFGALRRWMTRAFASSQYRHYRLCLNSEEEALLLEHSQEERILPLGYGNRHEDLPAFLGELAEVGRRHSWAVSDGARSAGSSDGARSEKTGAQPAQPIGAPKKAATGEAQEPVERPTDRSYRNTCETYLDWAANDWRYIELGGLGVEQDAQNAKRVQRLPLKKMYVSLQADPRSATERLREKELWRMDEVDRRRPVARPISSEEARRRILAEGPRGVAPAGSTGEDGISLKDAFARNRILVVLGHPGSGKSVLCQWLGSDLAARAHAMLPSDGAGPLRIPMRFRAVDYAKFNSTRLVNGDKPCGVSEFLASTLPSEAGGARRLRGMFERALADGEAVLLIDGLDELTDHRSEVIDALVTEVEAHVGADRTGNSKVVVTSRVAGYDDLYFTVDEVGRYFIRHMTAEQRGSFVTRFFDALDADDQAPLFVKRLETSDETVLRLASTPLMLVSLCSYWHRHGDLPASRSELYRRLLVDTAYRWRGFGAVDGGSTIDGLLGDEDEFLAMLSRIAIRIHEEFADGQILQEELLDTLDDALFGLGRFTEVDARPVGLKLIARIRERVGIFAEFAPRQFGFIHQTFREYLVAYDLLHRSSDSSGLGGPSNDELFLRLKDRIDDPRWREPMLLALGECVAETRVALIQLAIGSPDLDLEGWAGMVVAAALKRPASAADHDELRPLLELVACAYDSLPEIPDVLEELDTQISELRRHVGHDQFDDVALGLLAEDEALTGPLAALYWRRRWLTAGVLGGFAAAAHRDSAAWDWPIQRGLRRAAVEPIREATVKDRLDAPADTVEGREAFHLFELGRGRWEQERRRTAQIDIQAVPTGALPLREFFLDRSPQWEACMSDPACARVVCALFGGLDHHDALRWSSEQEDFERLLSLPDVARRSAIERRAAELVPRFGTDDIVYSIAVMLPAAGATVSRAEPAPVIDVSWMTAPSTPAVQRAMRQWLDHAPGDRDRLRQTLEQLATSETSAADRAEAELGLLVLDGRRMAADATSIGALTRTLEASGDAMIRGHCGWFEAIWAAQAPAADAERAAMHRFLLRVSFMVAGRPVSLLPFPPSLGGGPSGAHPVLLADYLARLILARSWSGDEPADLGLADEPAERVLAAAAWLTTLPYWGSRSELGADFKAALWHETMPHALACLPGGLEADLRPLLAWAHGQAPRLEPELSTAVNLALQSPATRTAADATPEPLSELYGYWRAARRVTRTHLEGIRQLAAGSPGPHTDLAYLLFALSRQAPESERGHWQMTALDLLEAEPDEGNLAEALCRFRGYLCKDRAVQRRARELTGTIESAFLRADAGGDFGEAGQALVSLLGTQVDAAARVSLLIVTRALQELARIEDAVADRGIDHGRVHGMARMARRHGFVEPWLRPLDQTMLASIATHIAEDPGDGEALVGQLSMVSRVEDDVVGELSALLERAESGAHWAASAQNLLVLHRARVDGGYAGMFRELVDLICTADATAAARAHLQLVGPVSSVDRDSRHYRLSQYGLDLWWELGREATIELDPRRRKLFYAALHEWDVDDAGAVADVARRASRDDQSRAIFVGMIDTASVWREEPQLALAEWLNGLAPDCALAEACLNLVSMLCTSGCGTDVTEELSAATARMGLGSDSTVRTVAGLSSADWRLGVAQLVADACIEALGDSAGSSACPETARRLFLARTTKVITCDATGTAQADFSGYGHLFWQQLGARPEDTAKFAPAELNDERAIALLGEWAGELDAGGAGQTKSPSLDYATLEAILNLLVVLSARESSMFRRWCPPESMQPVFSRAVVQMMSLSQVAGLTLLSRLRFIDLTPADGPGIVEVMDVALRSHPQTYAAVFDFLENVRHVRGESLAGAVLDRITGSPNESVAQGFAGLAAAYLELSTCSNADRLLLRQALRADSGEAGRRRSVHLIGSGNIQDPVSLIVGPDRRSEFRRLRSHV